MIRYEAQWARPNQALVASGLRGPEPKCKSICLSVCLSIYLTPFALHQMTFCVFATLYLTL